MPLIFIALMIFLGVVAAAFVIVPLMRSERSASHESLVPMVAVTVAVIGAFGLYRANSLWNWSDNGLPDNPAMQQLYQLQKTVNDRPDDHAGWLELGKFYLQFEQANGAVDALNKAYQLSRGHDPTTNLLLVDALSISAAPNSQARAAELVNATLKIAPDNRKALWYGGELAFAQGKPQTAILRWQALLTQTQLSDTLEAQSVARMLKERIQAAQSAQDQPAAPEAISVAVELDEKWQVTVEPSTTVFVLARAVGAPGPPLAVQKLSAGELPLSVSLSDANAMLPTRKISDFDDIEIVARVALSGTPQAKAGDYYGLALVKPGDSRDVKIVMNSVEP